MSDDKVIFWAVVATCALTAVTEVVVIVALLTGSL